MNQQPSVTRIKINTCLNKEREKNNIKSCEANVLSLMMKRKLKKTKETNGSKFLLTICILLMYIYCVSANKLYDEIKDVPCLFSPNNFELTEEV